MEEGKYWIEWLHSPELEARRVIQTLMDIKSGFFSRYNFLVLDYPQIHGVFLPRIKYNNIPNLPKCRNSDEISFISKKAGEAITSVKNQLVQLPDIPTVNDSEIFNRFTQVMPYYYDSAKTIFPVLNNHSLLLRIILTHYGTNASFSIEKKQNCLELTLWVRTTGVTLDQLVDNLLHSVISGVVLFLTKIYDDDTVRWQWREQLIDFLCQHTCLSVHFSHPVATLRELTSPEIDAQTKKASSQYLRELNLYTENNSTQTVENLMQRGVTTITFTKKELAILHVLVDNKNQFVSAEKICDEVLGIEYEGYYKWVIAKHIQRIRDKLETIGIRKSAILTKRKQGYGYFEDM